MNFPYHRYLTVSSTNRIAFDLARKGGIHGETVIALSQTSGRGRLGRSWSSPAGKGLYFSIILRPEIDIVDYSKLTMTTGCGVADALISACGVDAMLKWPNDIYIAGRKCCGILAEACFDSDTPHSPFAVMGIGVNVNTARSDFPDDVIDKATSLYVETGSHFNRDDLLRVIHAEVLQMISLLEREGFAPVLSRWQKGDYLRGRKLDWLTNGGDIVTGVSLGPDEDGQLKIRDDSGEVHVVVSGDVTPAEGKKGPSE